MLRSGENCFVEVTMSQFKAEGFQPRESWLVAVLGHTLCPVLYVDVFHISVTYPIITFVKSTLLTCDFKIFPKARNIKTNINSKRLRGKKAFSM